MSSHVMFPEPLYKQTWMSCSSKWIKTYATDVTYKQGKPIIYTELDKALYRTLQATLLFWKQVSAFFSENMALWQTAMIPV